MFGRYWLLRKQVFILVLYHTAFTVYMLLTDFYFNLGYFYSVVCIGIKSNKCISLTIQCVCLFFYLLVCVKYVHKSHRPGDESLVPWQALLASEKCECFRHLLKCVGVCRWKAQLLLWRVCMLLFSEASLSNGELLMSVCRHVSVCTDMSLARTILSLQEISLSHFLQWFINQLAFLSSLTLA